MNARGQLRALAVVSRKEVVRIVRIWVQTIVPPVITMTLYFVIFGNLIGRRIGEMGGFDYMQYMAPGLIMLGMLNNSFANSSSSLIVAKVQGNTVDFLMPPLSAAELAAAFIGGAVTRGVIVGTATALAVAPFVDITISHLWALLYFGLSAAAMMAMIGLIAGLWAEKFDHLAVITNFIIMPLAFLSGTFYSVEILPEPFYSISHVNPVFFLIDGFRFGFIGSHDSHLLIGGLVIAAINAALLAASYLLLRSGWRLKS